MTIGRIKTPRLLQSAGVLTVSVGAAVSLLLTASVPAYAGGNPKFEGVLDAATPTGFISSPTAYDISSGPATINFDTVVKNRTASKHTFTLNFSLHHILTYNGQNVADGQPGQPGITFTGPQGTTQSLMPGTQTFTVTWKAHATQTLSESYSLDSCGYYQVDIWAPVKGSSRSRATLASGFIRVLGCAAPGGPTPTPTGTPSATATPGPTPTGAVSAAVSTPSTGAGGMPLAGTWLMIAGLASIGVGTGLRRLQRRRR